MILFQAGDLFQVPDSSILNDLPSIISKIIEVTSQPDYSHNLNDQSVVEICITRITSAIRQVFVLNNKLGFLNT